MRLKPFVSAVACAVVGCSSAFAIEIQTTWNGGNHTGYQQWQSAIGGELTFNAIGWDPTGNYSAYSKNQVGGTGFNNFQSFCVEAKGSIGENHTYEAVINANNQTILSGGTLSLGAALLYSQFAQGKLGSAGSPAYSYFGINRQGSAALLQNAIWHFMGGQGAYDSKNPYEAYAASFFGGDAAANKAAGANDFGVHVLNVWEVGHVGEAGYQAQDVLVYLADGHESVPDGGLTVMLLGLGLSGIALVSRRMRR